MKKYLLFIGMDISKKWIDVAMSLNGKEKQMLHRRFDNQPSGFVKMLKWLMTRANLDLRAHAIFCMEHTGGYSIPLAAFLEQEQLDYVLESALRIKRSLGIRRGKDDKADAKAIARYLYLNYKDLKTSTLPAQALADLKNLLAYRARLIKQRKAIKVGSKETLKFSRQSPNLAWIANRSDELIAVLSQEIDQVHQQMKTIIDSDEHLSRIFDLVTSVKGVGLIIALNMMVHSNCFKAFDSSRQFACYIGIAPFHKQSGSSLNISAKVSHLGQKKLKALITNGVMSAIQYDKELKAYYHRKVSQGKIKYKVINAVKNKLVHRVFAVVQRGTPYVEIRNYA